LFKGCTEQIDMQDSKEISWASDYSEETQSESVDSPTQSESVDSPTQSESVDSGRGADLHSNGSSDADTWQQYRKWVSASIRRCTPGKVTETGRSRSSATGPKNKKNAHHVRQALLGKKPNQISSLSRKGNCFVAFLHTSRLFL
jgi:hypothetical protein